MDQTWEPVATVLQAHSPPDVREGRRESKAGVKKVSHSKRSLGQHLKCVLVGVLHYFCYFDDVRVGDMLVKEVAHGVDKNSLGPPPSQGFFELLRNESRIEATLVRVARNATEPLRKYRSVTMCAARTYLRASSNRIPRCIGPFDFGVCRHLAFAFCSLYGEFIITERERPVLGEVQGLSPTTTFPCPRPVWHFKSFPFTWQDMKDCKG